VMSDPEDSYRLHAPRELRRKIREDVPDRGCARLSAGHARAGKRRHA
jgi:hypothetical protein